MRSCFIAIVNNLYRQEFSQIISFTLIFLAMGISAYAVFQYFTHSERVWNLVAMYSGRGTGTYISPNNLACFLAMILPLALAYLLAGRITPMMRIVLGYAALVILVGIAVTFSRGGWMACAAALLALLGILHWQPPSPSSGVGAVGGFAWRRRYFFCEISDAHRFLHPARGPGAGQSIRCG